MGLSGYLAVLRARWAMVAAVTAVCLAFAAVLSFAATPQYVATAEVFLSVKVGGTAAQLSRATTYSQDLARTYAELATSRTVLEPVIRALRLDLTTDQVAAMVTARAPVREVVVEIAVRDSSPGRATALANAVATQLSRVGAELAPQVSDRSLPVQANTVTPAVVPTFAVYPRKALNLALGLVLGLLAGVVLAVAVDAHAARMAGGHGIAELAAAPALGVVRARRGRRGLARLSRRLGRGHPEGPTDQLWAAFGQLRDRRRLRTVLVTSALDDGATSLAASELAIAASRTGAEVLLVDADLQRPNFSGRLRLAGGDGLSSVLTGKRRWTDVVRRVPHSTLWVLPAGPEPPDPSALLGSDRMAGLLAELAGRYPLVLLKAPPVLRVADGLALSRLVDGVVVVAESRGLLRSRLADEVIALRTVGAPLLGVVLAG